MANWRDLMPVHPAADIFPLLDDADLVALGNDIKTNGLVSPIAVDFDLSNRNSKPILVDGRNRLAAMERVGIRVRLEEIHARRGGEVIGHRLAADDIDLNITEEETTISVIRGDPTEYIISANIHRRHLTLLQKKELTAALLKDNPGRSNRATGNIVKLDDKTVASVRREMESRAEIPHVDKVVDTKGREQPASRPKASAIPAREPTQQQRDIGARNAKIIASVTGQSLGEVNDNSELDDYSVNDSASEVAKPDVLEDNILNAIGGMNENARIFKKLLKVSDLDREAVARINTAIDGMVGKWRSIQSMLEKKGPPTVPVQPEPSGTTTLEWDGVVPCGSSPNDDHSHRCAPAPGGTYAAMVVRKDDGVFSHYSVSFVVDDKKGGKFNYLGSAKSLEMAKEIARQHAATASVKAA
jgi:ParB-like chromosome segregation protein Spo0J